MVMPIIANAVVSHVASKGADALMDKMKKGPGDGGALDVAPTPASAILKAGPEPLLPSLSGGMKPQMK